MILCFLICLIFYVASFAGDLSNTLEAIFLLVGMVFYMITHMLWSKWTDKVENLKKRLNELKERRRND